MMNYYNQDRKVSIAPMMDWTDKHFRFLIRLISKYVILYTEMISEHAIYYNRNSLKKLKSLLDYNPCEHPIIFQIGGSNIPIIKECIPIIEEWNYDGININCGCPSERVQDGKFGAILMAEPKLVANITKEIKKITNLPVSIKHRLGIKSNQIDKTNYNDLKEFIEVCYKEGGCEHFIIHARHAYLQKYNPKQNRIIPPLIYEWVYKIKDEFPNLKIEINGGIKTIEEIKKHLEYVDGVMIGRASYENTYFICSIDEFFLNQNSRLTRKEIFKKFIPYVIEQLQEGIYPHSIIPHTFGLFNGIKNSKKWKQYLTEHLLKLKQNSIENINPVDLYNLLIKSLDMLPDETYFNYEENRITTFL
ncbi:MAG: tRNA-dihydrouridine(20/20a) synthase [Leptospiraceae bacterium]|nr:MAG: tRNA-dihydrouridine(20/20a) synthase [Leptospiraceae bacterium]